MLCHTRRIHIVLRMIWRWIFSSYQLQFMHKWMWLTWLACIISSNPSRHMNIYESAGQIVAMSKDIHITSHMLMTTQRCWISQKLMTWNIKTFWLFVDNTKPNPMPIRNITQHVRIDKLINWQRRFHLQLEDILLGKTYNYHIAMFSANDIVTSAWLEMYKIEQNITRTSPT